MRHKNLLLDLNYTARMVHRHWQGELKKQKLHWGQPPLLGYLDNHDGSTQQAIAQALDVRAATMTKMVTRLEDQGFVRREKDPADKRVMRVFLTDQAKETMAILYEEMRLKDQQAFQGFSQEEKTVLAEMLEKIRENMDVVQYRHQGDNDEKSV